MFSPASSQLGSGLIPVPVGRSCCWKPVLRPPLLNMFWKLGSQRDRAVTHTLASPRALACPSLWAVKQVSSCEVLERALHLEDSGACCKPRIGRWPECTEVGLRCLT